MEALKIFRTKTAALKLESINELQERNSGIYKLAFSNADKKLQIVWFTAYNNTGINPDHSSKKTYLNISLGKNIGVVSDMYGSIIEPQISENIIMVIGEEPIYIEYYDINADSDGNWDIDGKDLEITIANGIVPIENITKHFGKSYFLSPY